MAKLLTADDILPLIASLTPQERDRSLLLMRGGAKSDSSVYAANPSKTDEFQADDVMLSWDADGWERFT